MPKNKKKRVAIKKTDNEKKELEKEINYVDKETFKKMLDEILVEDEELLRRLADR